VLGVLFCVIFGGIAAASDFEQTASFELPDDPFRTTRSEPLLATPHPAGIARRTATILRATSADFDSSMPTVDTTGFHSSMPTFDRDADNAIWRSTASETGWNAASQQPVQPISATYLPPPQTIDWNEAFPNGTAAPNPDVWHGGRRKGLFRDRPWIVDGPSVPEPMVFDMVRPMHAKKGELEANVLAVVPMHRRRKVVDWAPEIEYAVADGVAIEFEFPFLDDRLQALKFAAQYTFDVGLNNRLIHGYHGIYERHFDGDVSEITSLYLMGLRFNEVWSVVGMFGFRSTIESEARSHFTELIQNVSFFADVTERVIMGVETNMSHHLAGPSTLLIMPQSHIILNDNLTLQVGFGLEAGADYAVAVHAFRLVLER
jgi:hypothetical protein